MFNSNIVVILDKKVEHNKCLAFIFFVYILPLAECVCTHKNILIKFKRQPVTRSTGVSCHIHHSMNLNKTIYPV